MRFGELGFLFSPCKAKMGVFESLVVWWSMMAANVNVNFVLIQNILFSISIFHHTFEKIF